MKETLIISLLSLACLTSLALAANDSSADTASATILKWKDGKKAAFTLAFDDSAPTHLKYVIPELTKRGIPGTFYVNAGCKSYQAQQAEWEQQAKLPGIEFGNHTYSHVAATSVEQLEAELAKANDVINRLYPARKQPRLISYARPGGVAWRISPEEDSKLLAKYHVIQRPPFNGPPRTVLTIEQMRQSVDATIAKGEFGHFDFHGVGGDWHAASLEFFIALLDKLDSCRDQIWLTDAISEHKYSAQRDTAQVQIRRSDPEQIRLQLTCQAEPTLYDMPLTVSARVPAGWKQCQVTQGSARSAVVAVDGSIRFDAIPGPDEIVIQPVSGQSQIGVSR